MVISQRERQGTVVGFSQFRKCGLHRVHTCGSFGGLLLFYIVPILCLVNLIKCAMRDTKDQKRSNKKSLRGVRT
jgi:hypothetical protein